MQGLNQEVLRYQLLTAAAPGDVRSTVEQHLTLIQLLKMRDASGLAMRSGTHRGCGRRHLLGAVATDKPAALTVEEERVPAFMDLTSEDTTDA